MVGESAGIFDKGENYGENLMFGQFGKAKGIIIDKETCGDVLDEFVGNKFVERSESELLDKETGREEEGSSIMPEHS